MAGVGKIQISANEARDKWDERKEYYLALGYNDEIATAYAASDIQDLYTWDD